VIRAVIRQTAFFCVFDFYQLATGAFVAVALHKHQAKGFFTVVMIGIFHCLYDFAILYAIH
jgi:hypothetical protein